MKVFVSHERRAERIVREEKLSMIERENPLGERDAALKSQGAPGGGSPRMPRREIGAIARLEMLTTERPYAKLPRHLGSNGLSR